VYLTANQSITLSGDASGTGSTAITISIASFAGSTKGLVPVSVGGTTNFLRADGSWAAPAGGGGSVSQTAATLTVASTGASTAIVTVTDAAISSTSKIVISWGNISQMDVNTPEMDAVFFYATPAAGSMVVTLTSEAPLFGDYKILYLVTT
jgi:hypothetical protein